MIPEHLCYAKDVFDGKIIVNDLVKRQCELSLLDHENPPDDWVFKSEASKAVINFLKLCPHIEGPLATQGKLLDPLPWQKYFIGEIYGWWGKSLTGTRRYRNVFVQVPKKNGKSTISGALCVYETFFMDHGARVFTAATKRTQAEISYEAAEKMTTKMPCLAKYRKIARDKINCEETNSWCKAIAKDKRGSGIDGINPSFILLDESALNDDRMFVLTLSKSFGARPAGMMMRITTAQPEDNTVWLEDRDRLKEKLENMERNSREFALLYEPDKDDDPDDEATWFKVNPGLGTVKDLPTLRDDFEAASYSPSQKNIFYLRDLNIYTGVAEDAWIDMSLYDNLPHWNHLAQPPQIRRVVGLDMSQSQDLSVICYRYELNDPNRAYLRFKCFAAEDSLDSVPDRNRMDIEKLYRDAEKRGELQIAPGHLVDYDAIEKELKEEYEEFPWIMLGYDKYRINPVFNRLDEAGIPVGEVNYTAANLSSNVSILEGRINDEQYLVQHSPFIRWQISNTIAAPDSKGNRILTHNKKQPWKKQDAASALLIAERVWNIHEGEYVGEGGFYVGEF